jgi:phosphoribosylaminoimidazolecarboxamide formyltransferase / IMP cyclohydrolase
VTKAFEPVVLDLFSLDGRPSTALRYGENPHQWGMWFPQNPQNPGLLGGTVLHEGKGFSYVNLLDLDGALRTALSFEHPTVCIVKHASPCGVASAPTLAEAYTAAHDCDALSAFGGVIAANRPIDLAMAQAIGTRFVECIAAPQVEDDALVLLTLKKDRRILTVPADSVARCEARMLLGGIVIQQVDRGDPPEAEWKVLSARQPTEEEWWSLRFAWKACQPVLSNAVVLVQGTVTVGIGGGQPNRIDCAHTAIRRAGDKAKGSVLASDSFFPFADCVEAAAAAGVTAVIYQGGGKKDPEVIAAANAANIALVATGIRHFRH